MKRYSLLLLALAIGLISSMAAEIAVVDARVTDMCMSKRMVRVFDDYILADNSGMGVEMAVTINTEGLSGERILCIVNPLDRDENTLSDKYGEAMSTVAFNVSGNSKSYTVKVPLPYNWLVTEEAKTVGAIKVGVTAVALSQEVGDMKIFNIDESRMNIDKKNLPDKLMGDILGGGSGKEAMLGSLFGAMFNTADATSEEECPSCEGSKLCPHCDGLGYLDPSACRKCIQDPGFCRRCKGEGTITREYNFY